MKHQYKIWIAFFVMIMLVACAPAVVEEAVIQVGEKDYRIWFEGMIYAGVINKDQSELEILREISGIVVKREEDIKKAKEEKEIETRKKECLKNQKEECLKNSSNTWNNETKSCHYFWEDYIKQQNNIGA